MNKLAAKCKQVLTQCRDFLDEKALKTVNSGPLSTFHKFAHFWLMVIRSFSRNRCPVRASALAYTTLLGFIPMLFVAVSLSSSLLKKQGTEGINEFIDKFVSAVVGTGAASTNTAAGSTNDIAMTIDPTTGAATPATPTDFQHVIVEKINGFIQNIQPTSLGVTGIVLLVIVAISMISRIEATFNDIWGVSKGRSFLSQLILYWAAITLGTLLLAAAITMVGGSRFESTRHWIESTGFLGRMFFVLFPVMVLCVAFALFYMMMPNTKVHFRAALMGGLVAGVLWHLNNYVSVLYVSRWVTNSKIYGSLAVIPVFMVGLYFSWLILLFGAQVAYAYQNRAAYLQEKISENVNQRGREFIALRLMQCVGQRFLRGERPATVPEMADALLVPTRLVQRIMHCLLASGLVVEVVVEAVGRETAYSPARPIEAINCHDILLALRAGQGHELATRDDPARVEVYGEFEKIIEAERKASSCVNLLSMAKRAEELSVMKPRKLKAANDLDT